MIGKKSTSRLALALVVGFLGTGLMKGQEPGLASGIQAYTRADYRAAIAVFEGLDPSKLRADEQVVLHKFFALSLIARKQLERAREEFISLLTIDPGHELSNKEFSPSVLEFFQKARVTQGARLCDRSVQAYNSGQFQEAVIGLEQALLLNPRDVQSSEFLKLATNRLKEAEDERKAAEEKEKAEKREKCSPSRSWGDLDAKGLTCQGKDYSSDLKLPAQANRVTLIYSNHHFGVGTCWKIVLFDDEEKEVLTLEDPTHAFAGEKDPDKEARWRTLDLPAIYTITKVKMFGVGGHGFEKFMAQRVNRDFSDEFILGLEVVCPLADQAP